MSSKKELKTKTDDEQPEPLQLVDAEKLVEYRPKKRFTSSFASLLNGYADEIDSEIERIIRL